MNRTRKVLVGKQTSTLKPPCRSEMEVPLFLTEIRAERILFGANSISAPLKSLQSDANRYIVPTTAALRSVVKTGTLTIKRPWLFGVGSTFTLRRFKTGTSISQRTPYLRRNPVNKSSISRAILVAFMVLTFVTSSAIAQQSLPRSVEVRC